VVAVVVAVLVVAVLVAAVAVEDVFDVELPEDPQPAAASAAPARQRAHPRSATGG
jgi:hypothetical protein